MKQGASAAPSTTLHADLRAAPEGKVDGPRERVMDREGVSASGSESWSPDASTVAARRLGIAALVVALVHLVYTVLYQTLWSSASNRVGLAAGLLGLALSVGVATYLLRGPRPVARIVAVGVFYELYLALALSVSESWSVSYATTSAQVSWSALVIVLFPFLIPARPRVVLVASVAAAATTPLAMAVVFIGSGRSWPALDVVASFVIPPFVCALLAWAPTRVLSQMAAEVRQARRLGSYELTEPLGAGGMGEVWSAKHRLLARPAAVKLIKPEMLGAKSKVARELLQRRFEREAQVTASLDSPHTVALYDFGVSPDGTLFYVMELLRGVDLETLVQRFGPLPSERVVHLLLQACDSLDDAHSRGLIHRDIKPANLFVSRRGSTVDFVKLLDFGLVKRWSRDEDVDLARSLERLGAPVDETAVGQIVGTPAFLAPEAALGQQAVDHRADIYALGCVAYWMLTGQQLFAESTVIGMAVAHVTKEPASPSQRTERPIVPELEALVMACLQKDRDRRPATADALRRALLAIPLSEPWTRERALAFWQTHLPEK